MMDLPLWTALALAIAVAMCLDGLFGEPPAWLHPVVAMGHYLGAVAPRLSALPSGAAFMGGAAAWLIGAAVVALLASRLQAALLSSDSRLAGAILLGVLLKPMLSWRMLRDEVCAVEENLAVSLDEGRLRLARLVSRDVTRLDAHTVRESAIESLAENLNDALVAPLFWYAVAGLPGAAVYRFANTADAMWGYRDHREWMGKWAARADDALSWLPARITAALLCLVAGRRMPLVAMRAQARLTPSPNGGWPMGTMALLLSVRLRKPGSYVLNEGGRLSERDDTDRALQWSARAVIVWATICMLSIVAIGSAIGIPRTTP